MKNNKALIIIGIILLNILVIFTIGQSFLGKASDYEIKLSEARKYAEKELCQRSINAYNEALGYKDSLEIRLEMFDVYEKAIETGEYSKSNSLFSTVFGITELYPKEVKAYEEACKFLLKYEKYDSCAELLMKAEDLHVTSDKLDKILKEVRYLHKVSYTMYSDISSLYNNSYLAIADDTYNLLNPELANQVNGNFNYASSFSEDYAFVRSGDLENGFKSFLIDKSGVRQCYFDGVTESSGVGKGVDKDGNELLLLAGKKDDKYKYYDITGKEVFGEYVFAGRFRNNVAAVQESEGQWKLINATGKQIVDTVFEDVILNEFDDCAPKGLIFAKKDGKYNLYDTNGKQIGDFSCDGAKAFIEDITAFKSGDKWGFVDSQGKVIIDAQYEDAKAFSKGVAAVMLNGVWNFIDISNEVVIQGDYEDAGYLCDNGKCFVKMNGRWSVLNMYYIAD